MELSKVNPTALNHFQQAAGPKSPRADEVAHNVRHAIAEAGANAMKFPMPVMMAMNDLLVKLDPKGANLTRGAAGW